jgi:hypothetical protein
MSRLAAASTTSLQRFAHLNTHPLLRLLFITARPKLLQSRQSHTILNPEGPFLLYLLSFVRFSLCSGLVGCLKLSNLVSPTVLR